MTIYQADGYIGFRFPNLAISVTISPPNARLVDRYDNLLLYEHRYLAQLQVFASGKHFVSALVIFFVQNLLAIATNLLTVAEVRGGAPGGGRSVCLNVERVCRNGEAVLNENFHRGGNKMLS